MNGDSYSSNEEIHTPIDSKSKEEIRIHDSSNNISNNYIKELAANQGLSLKDYHQLVTEKKEKKRLMNDNMKKLIEGSERKWLEKRGKKELIDFTDEERSSLKKFFKSLDYDGSGSIGLEELEDPMISLGLAESREEIHKIMNSESEIDFNNFLKIIKSRNSKNTAKQSAVKTFFKDLIAGRIVDSKIQNSLTFQSIISTIRRKKLMDAIMAKDEELKSEGNKVLKVITMNNERHTQSF